MSYADQVIHRLREEELKLLDALRLKRRTREEKVEQEFTIGDRVADWVAATMGS